MVHAMAGSWQAAAFAVAQTATFLQVHLQGDMDKVNPARRANDASAATVGYFVWQCRLAAGLAIGSAAKGGA